MLKYLCMLGLIFLGLILAPDAEARRWTPKPSDLATDYGQIVDQRSNGELVMVFWIAPESVDKSTPNAEELRMILAEYLLIGVVHAKMSPLGRIDYNAPDGIALELSDGSKRQRLAEDSLPAAVVEFSTVLQAIFTQSLGPAGRGFHWLAFDGKGVPSCGKGGFWINFAGERYNYDTPIPGCTVN